MSLPLPQVEPTGVCRRGDLDGIGMPIQKPLHQGFGAMRRTFVRDPEDPSGGQTRRLSHDQVHQLVVGLNSALSLTYFEELAPANIAGDKMGQCALSFVFGLHTAGLMGDGALDDGFSVLCLDTGLIVSTDRIIFWCQGNSLRFQGEFAPLFGFHARVPAAILLLQGDSCGFVVTLREIRYCMPRKWKLRSYGL